MSALRRDVTDLGQVPQAVADLLKYARQQRGDEVHCYCVRLILQELRVNACRYGGSGGASAWIRADAEGVDVMVMDDGRGFCLEKTLQRTGLLEESGRGLFLVQSICAGRMRQNRRGNCIRVRFKG